MTMPDGPETPPKTAWWQPQNWSLRVKLGVVVLVPVVVALVLGVLRIADQARAANDLAQVDRVATAQGQVSELLRQLETERELATVYVAADRAGDPTRFDQQAAAVDGAAGPLEQVVAEIGDATASQAGTTAASALGALGEIRAQVRAGDVPASVIATRYSEVINPLLRLTDSLNRLVVEPEVAGLGTAVRALVTARNEASLQQSLIIAATTRPVPNRTEVAAVQGADARYLEALNQYRGALTAEQLSTFGQFTGGPAEDARTALITQLANLPDAPPIDRGQLERTFTDIIGQLDKAEREVRADLQATGLALQNSASNAAGISSVVLLLSLLLAALIVVLVARMLVRSLRTLRAAALDVANRRLPESVAAIRAGDGARPTIVPVPIHTNDEIGQVARAFDAVHGQAVALASEQAALQANVSSMFVNLSRRSQALVERQLQLIEQLESNEQDADQLSNLFQLDHLATRMRRNSENLLVLAGTNLARRNTAPVPLVDVLRAAVSEIEQYQRIVVQTPPNATVQGRVASDVVHLLAELLDNATNFSPPSSQVVMSTTRTNEGAIVVEIVDRGVGMVPNELAEANAQLSGPASVDLNVSRRMGLFVVGRLASRHGITVRLSQSSGGGLDTGITATVTLPPEIIPPSEPAESTPRPAPRPAPAPETNGVQQHAGTNGTSVAGSLSSLVAGNDGTSSESLFATSSPAVNGSSSAPPLPTRQPGSTLNPDGPPRTADDPAAQAAADQAAAREAEERLRAEREGAPTPAAKAGTESSAQPADQPKNGTASAATAFGAAAAFRAASEKAAEQRAEQAGKAADGLSENAAEAASAEPADAAETTEEEKADPAPAEPATEATAEEAADRDGGAAEDEARPADAPPLPRRTPGAGPTLAEQYGMGRTAPARPDQAQGVTPAGLPQRTPRPAQPAQQPGPAFAGGPGQRPAQFLSGLYGTGRPTSTPADKEADRPAPAQAEAAPAVTMPLPVVRQGQQSGQDAQQSESGAAAEERPTAATDAAQAEAPQREAPKVETAQTEAGEPETAEQQPAAEQAESPGAESAPAPARPAEAVPATKALPVAGGQQAVSAQAASNGAAAPAASGENTTGGASPSGTALFAAANPAAAPSATQSPTPTAPQQQAPSAGDGDGLGETTPIFEEIASAWFRSNRSVPVTWDTDPAPAPPAPAGNGVPWQPPQPKPTPRPASSFGPLPQPGAAVRPPQPAVPAQQQGPAQPPFAPPPQPLQPLQQPQPVPDAGFASAADEGWRRAEGVANEQPEEMTPAGLPKRRPRARLVPGSAGSAVLAAPPSAARSAENIRGRLSAYQRGVQRGRVSQNRPDAYPGPKTTGDHDEESS